MKILIIEDDLKINRLLQYNLEREGHTVNAVHDAEFSDRWLKKNMPDIILMDWNLPGKQGVDRCLELKIHPHFKRIPLLIISVKDRIADIDNALKHGADGFIPKPFMPNNITELINTHLSKMDPHLVRIPKRYSLKERIRRVLRPQRFAFSGLGY